MGVYYLWCCHDREEYIDPGQINLGCIKDWSTKFGGSARLAAWLLATRWKTAERVSDCGEECGEIEDTYKNITREAVEWFNKDYCNPGDTPCPVNPLLTYNETG